jgi:predicted RNA-binding Zn-ribbon protein involved in translation (DUF1610 family)
VRLGSGKVVCNLKKEEMKMKALGINMEEVYQKISMLSGIPVDELKRRTAELEEKESDICPNCGERMHEYAMPYKSGAVLLSYKCECGFMKYTYFMKDGKLYDANEDAIATVEAEQPVFDEIPEPPYQEIVDLFNSTCKSYRKVQLTDELEELIYAAWKLHPDVSYFAKVFNKTENSRFLRNRGAHSQFTLNWILRNIEKVASGRYDDYKF